MRQIKFRQWTGEKFVYWGFIDGGFIGPASGRGMGETFNPMTTPHEQFTGLHDRNGRDVCEGDILSSIDVKTNAFDEISVRVLFLVEFDDRGCFIAKEIGADDFYFLDDYEFEIIGNIHQNPELVGRVG